MPETPTDLIRKGLARLRCAGIDASRQEVVWMLEAAADRRQTELLGSVGSLEKDTLRRFEEFMIRRLDREPVQYILGSAHFFGRPFRVDPSVLIPRPETEVLVEQVLDHMPAGKRLCVLDVGTGSGCIAVTISLERPDAVVAATDISSAALATAKANAHLLGATPRFLLHDFLGSEAVPDSPFDIVITNPPYVPESEHGSMMPEVRKFEPNGALFTGGDPYLFYRRLADRASGLLAPGGFVFAEIHADGAGKVVDLLQEVALTGVRIEQDLAGKNRIVWGRRTF